MRLRLHGDYSYGSYVRDGLRYAVIRNYGVIERIRVLGDTGNPIIWQHGDPVDAQIMEIMVQAS